MVVNPLWSVIEPVVLLSHGLGDHLRSLSWLGAGLAKHGAVVIAVNHPASTHGDFDLQRGLQQWTRVKDLQAAPGQMLDNTNFAIHLNPQRIYAAGFSYGDWTALSLFRMPASEPILVIDCKLCKNQLMIQ